MGKAWDEDRKMLGDMSKGKLLNLFFLHIRNLWRVDGLYFLGIEEKLGSVSATEIDANCWKVMGKLEARHLKEVLGIKKINPASLMHILRNTSWALDQRDKEIEVAETMAVFRVTRCRTQETRIRKGLKVFPCKKVRFGYLKNFAEELNPEIEVICKVCPPGERPPSVWCEWEFRFKENR